jgi:ATP-dependent DNA helicase RecQ
MDVTVEAQKILSCISRMGQRFGIKAIIDTLRGSKGEKIIRTGLSKISTYGIMAEMTEKRIRDIINYLVLNEYILLTNSEFPVVKLTQKAKLVLFDGEKIIMKITKEEKKKIKPSKKITTESTELFSRLKALRYKLAQEKKVPAFVIFSDATLMDMCRKMPSNEEEFLEVSGVGQVKLKAYGKKFLDVLNEKV